MPELVSEDDLYLILCAGQFGNALRSNVPLSWTTSMFVVATAPA